jgi:hypothetical protein
MGSLGQQSEGEILLANVSRPKANRKRNAGMGANDANPRSLSESPNRVKNQQPTFKGLLSFIPMAYQYLRGSKINERWL